MLLAKDLPKVVLVGTGVVGRAILDAHIVAKVSVSVTDQNGDSLQAAIDILDLNSSEWQIQRTTLGDSQCVCLQHQRDNSAFASPLVIESIAERLDVKRAFFQQAERDFGDDAIICSNTSTLKISSIVDTIERPQNVCGMHFFMPVDQRHAVEIVATDQSSQQTIAACQDHVHRLNKSPLLVADSPGFIVNRLLSPYLNQSLLLLAHGVSADQIERAALRYGMPLSPLELIDWIGTRTMFDAGRVFWQSFPGRVDPSPIVPALIKKKLAGRATTAGMYDYVDGIRSEQLSTITQQIVQKYSLSPVDILDADVEHLLAIPMLIEGALAFQSGVTKRISDFELAMAGGLGYQHASGWLGYFRERGISAIDDSVERWAAQFKSMNASNADLARFLQS